MNEVSKCGMAVPLSHEVLREGEATAAAFDRYMNATPQERAEWARRAAEQRAAERAAAEPVEPTLDALLAKLGWGPLYARHVMQPYCECEQGMDDWELCQHARDLDFEVWQ